jgi:hypothetical protein
MPATPGHAHQGAPRFVIEAGVRGESNGLLLHGRIDVDSLDLGVAQRLLALGRRERLGQQLLDACRAEAAPPPDE